MQNRKVIKITGLGEESLLRPLGKVACFFGCALPAYVGAYLWGNPQSVDDYGEGTVYRGGSIALEAG